MFSGRTFPVVLVTDNNPGDTGISVGAIVVSLYPSSIISSERASHLRGHSWDSTEFSALLVEDLVGLTVVGVDGTDQTVL